MTPKFLWTIYTWWKACTKILGIIWLIFLATKILKVHFLIKICIFISYKKYPKHATHIFLKFYRWWGSLTKIFRIFGLQIILLQINKESALFMKLKIKEKNHFSRGYTLTCGPDMSVLSSPMNSSTVDGLITDFSAISQSNRTRFDSTWSMEDGASTGMLGLAWALPEMAQRR